MHKPFYSKRRLKKMGFTITQDRHFLNLSISSNGGSVKQAQNIYRMIKNSNKVVTASIDTYAGKSSVGSLIMNYSKKL